MKMEQIPAYELVTKQEIPDIHSMGSVSYTHLDVYKRQGKAAAAKAKETEIGTMNLDHIYEYAEELKKADADEHDISPLLFPNYARHER